MRAADAPDSASDDYAVGFAPVRAGRPAVLILGSLPGRVSLERGQYYAQPRNSFWPIMGELFGAGPELDYPARLERLTAHSIALWDVLASGSRPGSLDASIDRSSMVVNDIGGLLERSSAVELVCFNGKTAEALYRRKIVPTLDAALAAIETRALPSTSPAYAALPYARKLAAWTAALRPYLP